MNLWTSEQKILLFNRIGYIALFFLYLMASVSSGVATEYLSLGNVFFFPVDVLVFPVLLASLVLTLLWSRRLGEVPPNATLWYNATYMVGLSMSVLWTMQLIVLIYGYRYWHRIDFGDVLLRNAILLFWAVIAVAICRAVLGLVIQTKQTLFGGSRN